VAVDGGFLHVTSRGDDTRVDILAEHAELESEIDAAEAERQRAEAEQEVAQGNAAGRADLERAVARIRAKGRS
jgi:F0F1-type ATP synthase epsilon subunit